MPLLSNIELILNPNAASLSKRFLVKELWAQSIKKLLRRPSEPAREIGSYRLWLNELLQLRVLLLSLLQDEDVGVAILADREEVLISAFGLRQVARDDVCSAFALPSCKCARVPIGSAKTMPR